MNKIRYQCVVCVCACVCVFHFSALNCIIIFKPIWIFHIFTEIFECKELCKFGLFLAIQNINISSTIVLVSISKNRNIVNNIIYRFVLPYVKFICHQQIVYILSQTNQKHFQHCCSSLIDLTCCTRNWTRCNNWIFTSTYVLPSRKPKNHYHIKWTHLLLTTNLQT